MAKSRMGRYPKLQYFDSNNTKFVRVNKLSNYLILKLIKKPFVWIEGKHFLQAVPYKVMDAIKYTAKVRKLAI